MSNKKISALPDKLNPASTDIIPIVDASDSNNLVTKKTTLGAILRNLLSEDQKGAPLGVATLDAAGKIPVSQIPEDILNSLDGVQGPTGAAGIQGVVGPRGATGPSGYVGSDGATGPTGSFGPTGSTGVQGATGPRGFEGSSGPSGLLGASGPAGANGMTGSTGPSGVAGAKGETGVTGGIGITGATGVSPAVAAVPGFPNKISIGGVIVEAAAGATGPSGPQGPSGVAGYVGRDGSTGPKGDAGATGPRGSSFRLLGQLVDWPPTASPNFGDMWIVSDPIPIGANLTDLYLNENDGVAWIETDTGGAWLNVGPIRGPQGSQGPTGASGPRGTQGLQGSRGATGPQGDPATNYVLSVNQQTGAVVLSANSILLANSFTVKATSQGAYSDGSVISAGTPIETVVKNMLQTVVPATYTQPTLSLATNVSLIYEYGASVTSTLVPAWAANDAGAATVFRIKKDGVTAQTTSGTSPASYATSFTLNAATSFVVEADYGQGAQKTDNLGNASGSPIAAGTKISSTLTFTPQNKRYWGLSSSATITDSQIRALSSELATSRLQTRNDFNPNGQYIYFAYPVSFGLATIKFNGYIATSSFQLTTRNFTNAYGYTESYYIYRTQYVQTSPDIDIEVL